MAYYSYYIYKLINNKKALGISVLLLILGSTLHAQESQDVQIANEYLLQGQKQKALELYRDLAKNARNLPVIHHNYMSVLLDLGMFDEAKDHLRKVSRQDPANLQYKLDLGLVYVRSGDTGRAEKHFDELISQNKSNVQAIKMMADYLSARSMNEYAVKALTTSRKFLGNPYLFGLELAMLYRLQGQKDKMVEEYLSYVTQSSANIQYVKNVMQALLTKPDELESLERILYAKIQKNPDVEVYSDLLIWVTIQQKNFYASFIQARAYDKRYKREGEKSMEVAQVALDNEDFTTAARIYRYVAREYPGTSNYLMARLGLIRTREAQIKKRYPVNRDSVRTLVEDYKSFIEQYPDNAYSLEARRSQATLHAMYLDQKDEAIRLLEELTTNTKATLYLRSKAKLDLGDIYLLKGEPWESTLLYSQVEKIQKENPLGYEAKLKNAKLSYFKGDFRLAQEHLDILKEATTREIANDAMDLSMRIKENIAFDSTGEALKEYAAIELLLYQNKIDEALAAMEAFRAGGTKWVSKADAIMMNRTPLQTRGDSALVQMKAAGEIATILDDVYWLESNIRLQKGEFHKAIELLQKIISDYPADILADDAFFRTGEIYERHLNDLSRAMEVYREFLNRFPGSVYAAEARKRFRSLRGDFGPPVPTP
ncbi:MAG: tetratricopeptide repeat protein [Cyclobacteriaceae bacterium]|jgi:predicted Zn-dependent protease|nr:tetratricopeptide repeat protein [Cyclobacteriaceae bacterium]